jgi:thiamine biosynthesis protein ThiS
MEIFVNGKSFQLHDPKFTSINGLLEKLGLKPYSVAIERNGVIEDREQWEIALSEGDKLEIIKFVGGG